MQAETRQEHGYRRIGLAQGTSARQTLLLMAALVLLIATACNNGKMQVSRPQNDAEKRKHLTPRSAAYLAGVPVPKGFDIAERMTDSYEAAGMRFARQEYVGFADAYAIREFYKEHMPMSGWNYITSQEVKGQSSMRFESSDEECTVTIKPTRFLNRTRIQVILKPFKRSEVEPPSRRPMP